jgi:hypothetical protein
MILFFKVSYNVAESYAEMNSPHNKMTSWLTECDRDTYEGQGENQSEQRID